MPCWFWRPRQGREGRLQFRRECGREGRAPESFRLSVGSGHNGPVDACWRISALPRSGTVVSRSTNTPTSCTGLDMSTSTMNRRRGAVVPGETRILIPGVDWRFYDWLVDSIPEGSGVRVAFDGTDVEIMTTSPEHEDFKELLGKFVGLVAEELGIPYKSMGETTWKREGVNRGIEADQCFYFRPDKLTAAAKAKARKTNDVTDYPDPDLAIEVDLSPSELDRPGIYAGAQGCRSLAVRRTDVMDRSSLVAGPLHSCDREPAASRPRRGRSPMDPRARHKRPHILVPKGPPVGPERAVQGGLSLPGHAEFRARYTLCVVRDALPRSRTRPGARRRVRLDRTGVCLRPEIAIRDRTDVEQPQPVQRSSVEANFMDGAQALQALDDPKNLLVAELPSRVECKRALEPAMSQPSAAPVLGVIGVGIEHHHEDQAQKGRLKVIDDDAVASHLGDQRSRFLAWRCRSATQPRIRASSKITPSRPRIPNRGRHRFAFRVAVSGAG